MFQIRCYYSTVNRKKKPFLFDYMRKNSFVYLCFKNTVWSRIQYFFSFFRENYPFDKFLSKSCTEHSLYRKFLNYHPDLPNPDFPSLEKQNYCIYINTISWMIKSPIPLSTFFKMWNTKHFCSMCQIVIK